MKWLAVNKAFRNTKVSYSKIVAINPATICMIEPLGIEGSKIYFNKSTVVVKETFEEIMAMLGGDCEWKMP